MRIRKALPEDETGITRLLNTRPEGLAGLRVAEDLLGSEKMLAWVAVENEDIVGITCARLRTLCGPQGDSTPAGYWSVLYIHPDHRDKMLYPMLPMRMFRDLERAGVPILYSAIRRPQVAQAHLKIGLQQIGVWKVALKPLRPARLVARMKGLEKTLGLLAQPVDACAQTAWSIFRAGASLRAGFRGDLEGIAVRGLSNMLRHNASAIRQDWSLSDVRARYDDASGHAYDMRGAYQNGRLVAALVGRRVKRIEGVVVYIVLEVCALDGWSHAASALLLHAEERAYELDCDAILALDHALDLPPNQLTSLGYVRTDQEYTLMMRKARRAKNCDWLDVSTPWQFSLGDHDAF